MISGILLALLAAVIYGFLGICFEVAAKRRYPVWDVILYKQFSGFLMGLACTAWLGLPLYEPRLLWTGALGAASYVLTCVCYLLASRERDIASNWTLLNLSVALPILVSVFWFGDRFTAAKALAVVFTLCSIVLIGGGRRGLQLSGGSRWLRFIFGAFLLNGVLVILFRFVPDGYGALFTAYFYGISFLLVLPYKLHARNWKPERGMALVSVAGAATHWSGIMLTMAALQTVGKVSAQAGVVVYPITNGLVIPVGVILGVLLLKQKLSRATQWGVLTGMAALVLFFLP